VKKNQAGQFSQERQKNVVCGLLSPYYPMNLEVSKSQIGTEKEMEPFAVKDHVGFGVFSVSILVVVAVICGVKFRRGC
jgi:hypothetical protein